MHMTKPTRPLFLLTVISASTALACGIAVKRDLSTIPQGQVGFDDMCGLQDYFDSLEAKVAKEPFVASSVDLEGGDGVHTIRGGRARLVFEGSFLLKNGRRILEDNWRKLPEQLATTDKFEIEVRWAERAGVRRVVTDQPSVLYIGNESWDLPYQACLSDWLYGEPLYRQRRALFGLPEPLPPARPLDLALDAGAADADTDGGAAAATPDAR
jgi:hypothetical protein